MTAVPSADFPMPPGPSITVTEKPAPASIAARRCATSAYRAVNAEMSAGSSAGTIGSPIETLCSGAPRSMTGSSASTACWSLRSSAPGSRPSSSIMTALVDLQRVHAREARYRASIN
ncbi:hypothetical protein ACFQYP_42700 [Nonomuraea antimicrobica]